MSAPTVVLGLDWIFELLLLLVEELLSTGVQESVFGFLVALSPISFAQVTV